MQTLRNIAIIIALQLGQPIWAQKLLPYVVFNATKGVVLKSPVRNEDFYPVKGTKLYEKDTFLLKDDRYVVKLKDKRNGEIFTWDEGKGAITPLQIVSLKRYDKFDRFLSFLISLAEETGFDTKPVRTSQGLIYKGEPKNKENALSISIASQIRKNISDSIYEDGVCISKVYSSDSTFCYSVQNCDTINYAMVLFTVTKEGVFKHDDILVNELGRVRPDGIEYLRLIPNYSLKLDYFSLSDANGEVERTCYVLLFNPSDFYLKKENEKYEFLINWNIISKELTFQGDVARVINLRK